MANQNQNVSKSIMKKTIFSLFFWGIALLANAQTPDLILTNGKIFTSDTTQLYVEALAIKDGRITKSGTTDAIEKLATKNTKHLNLNGLLVVPGFNDAHNHLPDCLIGNEVALKENTMDPSWQWILDTLQQLTKTTPKGQWILIPIGPVIANSSEVTRFDLDKITTDHPVRLLSWMGHVCIFNTFGLKKMGISETSLDPKGGFYERLQDGKTLTGKAIEKNAYNPNTSYQRVAAMRDEKKLVSELQEITQALLQLGITSYQNMCSGATAGDYVKIWKKAGLPFRLRLIRWGDINPDGTLSIPGKELPKKISSLPLVTVSGTKWLMDGTPDEEYAEQFEPYPDRSNWYGKMNYTLPEVEKMIKEAVSRHDQLMFHIVGDKSVGKLLDVMEKMNIDWKPLRPRFEHADKIDYLPKYLEQAKRMGIVVVENPTNFSENFPSIRKTSPFDMAMKTLLLKGIPLGIGSDGPFNPFLNIMFAVTHPRRPSEAISIEDAVIAYTATNAFAEFEEMNKGMLTVGKVADLAVLSQDIFKIPVADLPQTKSVLTIVNGKIVYDAQVLKAK
jgi:predicted amidohydrolase YtcJ